jgi:hypothetical protein
VLAPLMAISFISFHSAFNSELARSISLGALVMALPTLIFSILGIVGSLRSRPILPIPSGARTSVLAKASMVLSVAGYFTSGLVSAAGIFAGILALRTICLGHQHRGQKLAVSAITTAISVIALEFAVPSWDKVSGPDIKGVSALASVSRFVATNGWNLYTNKGSCITWEYLEPRYFITDLPWKASTSQRFQAVTSDGILYVLLDSGFHHDYTGVAYNPNTNRFDTCIRGFKPIGEHWYVWAQPEFWQSADLDARYE